MRCQLLPLLLLTLPMLPRRILAQQLPDEPAPMVVPQVVSSADSVRLLRRAKRAQSSFEQLRVFNLPRSFAGASSGRCDVRVGRWCYWHDEEDETREPPPEAPRIRSARERLVATLDSLRSRLPGDRWIAGQLVFYLSEAGRGADALGAARACAATAPDAGMRAWCDALAGYALHRAGDYVAADSAYDEMLARLPETERCNWLDLGVLLDDGAAKPYRALSCAGRAGVNARFWRLGKPLYLTDGNDLKTEIFARITQGRIQRDARNPMGMTMSDLDREFLLRYGGSNWYEREDPPIGSMQDASIIGHESGRATVNVVPAARALAAPESLATTDWSFDLPTAHMNYSPAYLTHLHPLPRYQLALFRRGDSALVVAALDARGDTTLSPSHLEAGLLLAPLDGTNIGVPAGETVRDTDVREVLTARTPWQPFIASLELLDRARKAAVRARFAVRPPFATSRLAASDLLLFAPNGQLPVTIEDALPLALATDTVSASTPLGLFWEVYGARPAGELIGFSVGVERTGTSWLRHTAEALHLTARGAPVHVRWQETPVVRDGIASRAVVLDLSHLPPGRYRVRLSIAPRGDPPAVTTREIEIR